MTKPNNKSGYYTAVRVAKAYVDQDGSQTSKARRLARRDRAVMGRIWAKARKAEAMA